MWNEITFAISTFSSNSLLKPDLSLNDQRLWQSFKKCIKTELNIAMQFDWKIEWFLNKMQM